MIRKYFYTVLLLFSALTGMAQEKIILLNEGSWQADNGRMTYFENGNIVSNQWFRDNNGMKLGDTPNDIIQINDNLLAIAVNWSNIIQFITPQGKAVAATEDVPNNRQLATDGEYVYVTSYAHECGTVTGFKTFEKGFVAKIDIKSFKVVDAVEVGYEPDGIAYYDGHLFVANSGGYAFQEGHDYETTLTIVDANSMKVVKTVDTGCINLYGKMSQSGKYLCVCSEGDYYEMGARSVIVDCQRVIQGVSDSFAVIDYAATYNTVTREGAFLAIGSRYSFLTGEYLFDYLTIDPQRVMESGGKEGVQQTLPGTMMNDIGKMASPYSIYVNPYTGYMYATDASSFASGGTLHQWSPEGKYIGKYSVYINPSHLLALPPDGKFTGIENVVQDSNSEVIYDLSGRRVATPQRGTVYLQGGKKYFVR